jgi:hypothetical protein
VAYHQEIEPLPFPRWEKKPLCDKNDFVYIYIAKSV